MFVYVYVQIVYRKRKESEKWSDLLRGNEEIGLELEDCVNPAVVYLPDDDNDSGLHNVVFNEILLKLKQSRYSFACIVRGKITSFKRTWKITYTVCALLMCLIVIIFNSR